MLSDAWLAGQLEARQADPALTSVLAEALGDDDFEVIVAAGLRLHVLRV